MCRFSLGSACGYFLMRGEWHKGLSGFRPNRALAERLEIWRGE
jgi:hypothetical protein